MSAHLALACPLLAIAAPVLLAFNTAPSATFYNQAVALTGWGLWIGWQGFVTSPQPAPFTRPIAVIRRLMAAILTLLVSIGASWSADRLPTNLALAAAGQLLALMLVTGFGGWEIRLHAAQSTNRMREICLVLVAASACSLLISLIQVFTPSWTDGNFIAHQTLLGRATGNLRQPNHLSTLLLWGCAATVWLGEKGGWPRRWAIALLMALVFGVMLTASRTGTIGVLMLAVWGVLDRDLSKPMRRALWLAPLVYLLTWEGMSVFSHLEGQAFGGEARYSGNSDISSSRFAIWRNTLALIAMTPWTGVGFGNFNFAWSLTPFPDRPIAFFDHTHNIVLQFLVELGIPLALLVLGLLAWAWWGLVRQARASARPAIGTAGARAVLYMVTLVGVHSLLEYPLWYAYFLLPTAFMWSLALAQAPDENAPPLEPAAQARAQARAEWWRKGLLAGSVVMVLGTVYAVLDYLTVVQIFAPSAGAGPLDARIARGQRSTFFGYQADYAAVTTAAEPGRVIEQFEGPLHNLIDGRLMIAYAKALHETGQEDKARFVVDRLREFKRLGKEPFLEVCNEPLEDDEPVPFQCVPYSGPPMDWRDFVKQK